MLAPQRIRYAMKFLGRRLDIEGISHALLGTT